MPALSENTLDIGRHQVHVLSWKMTEILLTIDENECNVVIPRLNGFPTTGRPKLTWQYILAYPIMTVIELKESGSSSVLQHIIIHIVSPLLSASKNTSRKQKRSLLNSASSQASPSVTSIQGGNLPHPHLLNYVHWASEKCTDSILPLAMSSWKWSISWDQLMFHSIGRTHRTFTVRFKLAGTSVGIHQRFKLNDPMHSG